VRAGAVAVGKRCDDEVAPGDVADLGADVLDDADELVADRAGLEGRLAAVVLQVRAADAREHDPHHGVPRLGDHGVGPLLDTDGAGFVEDGSAHGFQRSSVRREVRGPVRGVLTGHLSAVAADVIWLS
jgi:hypothetical protein